MPARFRRTICAGRTALAMGPSTRGRSRYDGMEISEAWKWKAGDQKLKKLLAEWMLGASTLSEMLGEKLVMPGLRMRSVTWAVSEKSYSLRRACDLVGLQPNSCRYASTPSDEGGLGITEAISLAKMAVWLSLPELATGSGKVSGLITRTVSNLQG